jgi:hyperosmotically inducible periplasmic protein
MGNRVRYLFLVAVVAWCTAAVPSLAQPVEDASSPAVAHADHPDHPDQALARAVRRALGNTHGLDDAGILVRARHGAVTLSGTVRSVDAMNEAGQVAQRVKGVTSVTNKLTLFRGENG